MSYLTAQDKETFREKGYLVKHDAIPSHLLEPAQDVIWDNIYVDRSDPSTWIGGGKSGSQGLDDFPQFDTLLFDTPVFAMVEELTGEGQLVPLRSPNSAVFLRFPTPGKWDGPQLIHMDGHGGKNGQANHWTVGITLYLSDVKPQGGGTCVWPETHKHMAEYFKTHSRASLKKEFYDVPGYDESHVTSPIEILNWDKNAYDEITGPAGTVLMWHSHLLHAATDNTQKDIRMATISRLRWKNWQDRIFEDPDDMWEYWKGM